MCRAGALDARGVPGPVPGRRPQGCRAPASGGSFRGPGRCGGRPASRVARRSGRRGARSVGTRWPTRAGLPNGQTSLSVAAGNAIPCPDARPLPDRLGPADGERPPAGEGRRGPHGRPVDHTRSAPCTAVHARGGNGVGAASRRRDRPGRTGHRRGGVLAGRRPVGRRDRADPRHGTGTRGRVVAHR